MDESSDHEFSLVLSFDTDNKEFCRGVEVGLLYAGVGFMEISHVQTMTKMIHATNAEMALRMAESCGLDVISKDIDDEWIEITFTVKGGAE